MRRIGSVAIVFIGLWAIVQALTRISPAYRDLITYDLPMLAAALVPTAILLVFGVVLIRNHRKLAKRWFHDSPFDISVDGAQLLRLALIFLGIFWMTSGVAGLVGAFFATIEKNAFLGDFMPTVGFWSGIIPTYVAPMFELALGAFIAVRARPLANRLWWVREDEAAGVRDDYEYACPACGEPYDPLDYRPGAEMKCVRCGTPLPDTTPRNFCPRCGKRLSDTQAAACPACGTVFVAPGEAEYECNECGADVMDSDSFCLNCGEPIEGLEDEEKQ